MQEFVEVIFRSDRIGYFVNQKDLELIPDTDVVVKVERGEDIGRVNNSSYYDDGLTTKYEKGEIEKVLRIATEQDLKQLEKVKIKEKEVQDKFLSMVKKHPFEMKLLDAIYQLDGNKLTFFFTAEGRIDFREFVRELATEFKTRIELHQSSGREDARRLGGLGMCGKSYCCVSFLKKFNQVTIQMAKDQNLISNLSKISGPCGRLLCCLHYEEDFYLEKQEKFPRLTDKITHKGINMYVSKNDYYNDKVYLSSEDNDNIILSLDEYNKLKKKR